MLQALGFDLLDQEGGPVRHGALGLRDLAVISDSHVLPELKECTFRIACDVTNPLCGPQGCSAVFGPQKGADSAMISQMDQWLSSYAALAGKSFPETNPAHAGAGAAGGLGFAFLTFFHATLESGVNIILEETHLSDYIKMQILSSPEKAVWMVRPSWGKRLSALQRLPENFKNLCLHFPAA